MEQLNFPKYPLRLKTRENKTLIFDIIRKKYVVLTPEEWVRQHCIWYLIHEKNIPQSLISVEKQLLLNHQKKRTDIVVYHKTGKPFLVVECKAPSVTITQDTFDQIARYNMELHSDFLFLTNGLNHFCCMMDHQNKKYEFLPEIPLFEF